VDRFFLLIPALALLATIAIAFVVYAARCAIGRAPDMGEVKHNLVFGRFFARFLVWLISPIERLLIGRVSPNVITAASLALCAIAGGAVAVGRLASAVWLFAIAGILDVLDGRLARKVHHDSQAGALFDSVSDRWGELFVFAGYLWFLRDSAWLAAVLLALGGSMMVSYTRARAEALGVRLANGVMQRAERIVVITGGTLVAAWVGLLDADAITPILGITMLVCGVASTATAINRFVVAYRVLAARKAEPLVVLPAPRPPVISTPTPAHAVRKVTVTQASR
jgi:CDP-diacylglycerol--glycerol-3-phosphate 3-phosphatidyltransferase